MSKPDQQNPEFCSEFCTGKLKGEDGKVYTCDDCPVAVSSSLRSKSSRTVGWLVSRVKRLEADFVQYLIESCTFTKSGNELTALPNTLNEIECKLMDDILELREWITEMLEEEGLNYE